MSELVECPQCGRRTRTSRMVAAPDHAGHEAECDTCEADRQAVRELFTPLGEPPRRAVLTCAVAQSRVKRSGVSRAVTCCHTWDTRCARRPLSVSSP